MTTNPANPCASAIGCLDVMRPIVLVGMMGVGKTTVGRRLAKRLKLPFVDADHEIELAAGMTIPDIFKCHGEQAFRDGERRVIRRLMDGAPKVLATGGGAFINEQTRCVLKDRAISVWLDADLETLVDRTARRDNRPLLKQGNPREILGKLKDDRQPFYSQADLHISSSGGPHAQVVDRIIEALAAHLDRKPGRAS